MPGISKAIRDRLTDPDLRLTLFTNRLQLHNANNRLLLCDLSKFRTHEMFSKSVNLSTRRNGGVETIPKFVDSILI